VRLSIGSLCSGYEGLGMAIQAVFPDSQLAWVSDIDKGACKVLAHRFPGVPNLGDMTAIDWGQVEPVDVITGGTPCQDLSHAGKRAGMTEGTRSNLWVAMREAIATIRPSLVIWENVGGAYSAAADSEMESREGRLGDRPGRPALRALGRVLGDLASLGYVGGWHGLRAADVGAPHGRLRVFVVATDAQGGGRKIQSLEHDGRRPLVRPVAGAGCGVGAGNPAAGVQDVGRGSRLLPSPRTSDTNGAGQHGDGGLDLRTAVTLMPTPRATDGTKGRPNQRGSSGDLMLPSAVAQLLPTPSVADVEGGRKARSGDRSDELLLNGIAAEQKWGDYAAAIARWEHVIGRPAPAPTMTSSKGNPQLSPAFTEWMMGLPVGWITDVPGVTRNEALKLCGNGVVPQQAAAAIRFLLPLISTEVAA
jgi:DNA (cytosine-5)-methyltransferase 1